MQAAYYSLDVVASTCHACITILIPHKGHVDVLFGLLPCLMHGNYKLGLIRTGKHRTIKVPPILRGSWLANIANDLPTALVCSTSVFQNQVLKTNVHNPLWLYVWSLLFKVTGRLVWLLVVNVDVGRCCVIICYEFMRACWARLHPGTTLSTNHLTGTICGLFIHIFDWLIDMHHAQSLFRR